MSKEAEFILTDLGPCRRVICRAEDSWLACASLKAAWSPPTELRTRLSLMQEIHCRTSAGPRRLWVFVLPPPPRPITSELLTSNISSIHFFTYLFSLQLILFSTATHSNRASPMADDSVFHHPVAKQLFICHGVCVPLTYYKDGNSNSATALCF